MRSAPASEGGRRPTGRRPRSGKSRVLWSAPQPRQPKAPVALRADQYRDDVLDDDGRRECEHRASLVCGAGHEAVHESDVIERPALCVIAPAHGDDQGGGEALRTLGAHQSVDHFADGRSRQMPTRRLWRRAPRTMVRRHAARPTARSRRFPGRRLSRGSIRRAQVDRFAVAFSGPMYRPSTPHIPIPSPRRRCCGRTDAGRDSHRWGTAPFHGTPLRSCFPHEPHDAPDVGFVAGVEPAHAPRERHAASGATAGPAPWVPVPSERAGVRWFVASRQGGRGSGARRNGGRARGSRPRRGEARRRPSTSDASGPQRLSAVRWVRDRRQSPGPLAHL